MELYSLSGAFDGGLEKRRCLVGERQEVGLDADQTQSQLVHIAHQVFIQEEAGFRLRLLYLDHRDVHTVLNIPLVSFFVVFFDSLD